MGKYFLSHNGQDQQKFKICVRIINYLMLKKTKQSNCTHGRLNVNLHLFICCYSSRDFSLTQSFLCVLSCEKPPFSTVSWLFLSMGDDINNNHKFDSSMSRGFVWFFFSLSIANECVDIFQLSLVFESTVSVK